MNKRILRGVAATATAAAATLAFTTPAHAAAPPVGTVPDGVGFIQTKSTHDAGGVYYRISVDWNYKYDYQGVRRVSVNPLVVYRTDEAVTSVGNPEDAGLDLHFDVYSFYGGAAHLVQHKVYDGLDLDAAADNQASFNPANPVSNADDTFVRVTVGTDGDGFGNSPWVIFTQPDGIGLKPAI